MWCGMMMMNHPHDFENASTRRHVSASQRLPKKRTIMPACLHVASINDRSLSISFAIASITQTSWLLFHASSFTTYSSIIFHATFLIDEHARNGKNRIDRARLP
jgi:hypothetical protein